MKLLISMEVGDSLSEALEFKEEVEGSLLVAGSKSEVPIEIGVLGSSPAPEENYIDIVFDGPPEAVPGRFVEVENKEGMSISVGDWVERPDGFWALRIYDVPGVE